MPALPLHERDVSSKGAKLAIILSLSLVLSFLLLLAVGLVLLARYYKRKNLANSANHGNVEYAGQGGGARGSGDEYTPQGTSGLSEPGVALELEKYKRGRGH